jgi:cell division GTPase FtsZ
MESANEIALAKFEKERSREGKKASCELARLEGHVDFLFIYDSNRLMKSGLLRA